MKKPLTPRQQEILSHIAQSIRRTGIVPSVREIGHALGMRSPSTVHQHLSLMEAQGILKRNYHKMRSMEITGHRVLPAVELPLLGNVVAGLPTESAVVPETVSVPARMVGRGKHFALRVMGESMRDEDIAQGDTLVVRQTHRAAAGDLVIALVGGHETTVKRFYPERGRVRLQPSNRDLKPIRVRKADVQIQGVVVGLLRNYTPD